MAIETTGPLLNAKTAAVIIGGIAILLFLGERETARATKSVLNDAGVIANEVNPTNPDNVINRGANKLFQKVTGSHVDTIGTWLYGVLHPEEAADSTWLHANPARGG
jgi:hypothetical protein